MANVKPELRIALLKVSTVSEMPACITPEWDESALAVVTAVEEHGKPLFRVASTSDTHLPISRVPMYVSCSVLTR